MTAPTTIADVLAMSRLASPAYTDEEMDDRSLRSIWCRGRRRRCRSWRRWGAKRSWR
jgi:hypothetical protein